MITPSFNLTATERVLPKLALDFTTASLDPRVTFTRSGDTATVINSSGYVETVLANTPRFDYDPSTLACKGLLIEESRLNSVLYSQALNNVAWTNYANVTGDTETSPDGTQNADTLAISTAGVWLFQNISVASGSAITVTVYAKYNGTDWLRLRIADTTATNFTDVFFDVRNGEKGSLLSGGTAVTASSSSISNAGNGWWRCVSSVSTIGLTTIRLQFANVASNNTATRSGSLYMWGAQFEVGAFATSYIPTTTTALTRNADVATMTGTNFSDWYSAGFGSVVARVLPSTVLGTRPALQFDDATADEVITLRGSTTNPELVIVDGGSPQAQIDAGTIAANTAYSLGAAWDTDNCAAAINGGAAVTDTSATIPTVTQARLGSDGTNYLNGNLQTLRYWPQRIINAEVQAFSK